MPLAGYITCPCREKQSGTEEHPGDQHVLNHGDHAKAGTGPEHSKGSRRFFRVATEQGILVVLCLRL